MRGVGVETELFERKHMKLLQSLNLFLQTAELDKEIALLHSEKHAEREGGA